MSRLVLVTLWLMLGHAVAGAAYVGLVQTPDSNLLMLALSALLAVIALAALVTTSLSAARGLEAFEQPWRVWRRLPAMLPGVIVAVAVIGTLCWAAGAFEQWWLARAGQVDATAIVVGDVTGTTWLHTVVRWLVAFIQWVIVPVWLATVLAWAAGYGTRHVISMKWLLASLRPRVVLVALIAVVVLVWLPWQYAYWRPAGLTPSLELAFIGAKLFALYAALNFAWALLLEEAIRPVRQRVPLL